MVIATVKPRKRKIYLASSWRNEEQPAYVQILRDTGHEVYDFRNPAPGKNGFAWSQMDPEWKSWTLKQYRDALETSPIAMEGFRFDYDALNWCDTCVILLPCGRSAHLEAGYAAGQGKDVIFKISENQFEPELMYLLGHGIATNVDELLAMLNQTRSRFG